MTIRERLLEYAAKYQDGFIVLVLEEKNYHAYTSELVFYIPSFMKRDWYDYHEFLIECRGSARPIIFFKKNKEKY